MRFVKMHGLGNDYVYVDGFENRRAPWRRLARLVSDRHFGVGSDGLIALLPSRRAPRPGSGRADFQMRMFNADGSEGEMCGNGVRCLAKLAWDLGRTRKRAFAFETKGGRVSVRIVRHTGREARVSVDMGAPRALEPEPRDPKSRTFRASTLRAAGRVFRIHEVSMGNPHCVIFVPDTERFPVTEIGPAIERHSRFPNRTNVEFVQVLSRGTVRQRTWERGSGETLACGSGACATAVAGFLTGRTGRRVTVRLRGGDLAVELGRDGHVHMTGPAVTAFEGDFPLRGKS